MKLLQGHLVLQTPTKLALDLKPEFFLKIFNGFLFYDYFVATLE